jgi:hypothetical protein
MGNSEWGAVLLGAVTAVSAGLRAPDTHKSAWIDASPGVQAYELFFLASVNRLDIVKLLGRYCPCVR